MDKAEQHKESPYAVWVWGIVVFCGIWLAGSYLIGEASTSARKAPTQAPVVTGRPAPPPVEWRGATNLVEVAHRIITRLEGELAAMGIDGSNVVANAKTHPQRLVRPVPESDKLVPRLRLLVLSDEDEAKIAHNYVDYCRAQCLFADNDAAGLARVRRIVARLVPVIPQIAGEPEVHLLRDDSVNACCLPDGTVFVNTGTLKAIQDDALLAAILAHELGHAAAHHGNEGISRALKAAATGVAVEEGVADIAPILDSGEGVSIIRVVYGLGSAVVYTCPRDRRMEAEADRLGTRYLARAGFDPEAMVRLFEFFEAIVPQNPDLFMKLLSTHPLHAERIKHAREVLAEPDLREMPKKGWSDKLMEKANDIDFTAIKPEDFGQITNAVPHMPTNITHAVSIPTNIADKVKDIKDRGVGLGTNIWHNRPKLPFGKGKDGESSAGE